MHVHPPPATAGNHCVVKIKGRCLLKAASFLAPQNSETYSYQSNTFMYFMLLSLLHIADCYLKVAALQS